MTLGHASTLKQVHIILVLGDKHTVGEAKELVPVTNVRHGKLGMDSISDVLLQS